MTPKQAVEYMQTTGKAVKSNDPEVPAINHRGYWKLFRNGRVLMLLPDTACSAKVWVDASIEDFLTDPYQYETYE